MRPQPSDDSGREVSKGGLSLYARNSHRKHNTNEKEREMSRRVLQICIVAAALATVVPQALSQSRISIDTIAYNYVGPIYIDPASELARWPAISLPLLESIVRSRRRRARRRPFSPTAPSERPAPSLRQSYWPTAHPSRPCQTVMRGS